MPKQFGPVQGAGTSIIEQDAGAQIVPSAFGTTVFVGVTEKGNVGEILDCPKERQFIRKCGSFVSGSELPENAFDFYQYGGGAGRLYVVRVTDGNEVASADYALSRHGNRGEYVNRGSSGATKNSLLKVEAKNGGRWGGAERVLSFAFSTLGDLTETTINYPAGGLLVDELKGATLQVLGVTTKSYLVVGNTATVITVKSDSTMSTDLANGSDAANKKVLLKLDTVTRAFTSNGVTAGDRQALSIRWKDGEESQSEFFGMDILIDGVPIRSYNNLSLDPASKWYIDDVVNQDPNNDFVTVTVLFTGTFSAANRPANWFGQYKNFAGATLTTEIAHVKSVTPVGATDPGFVNDFVYPANTVRQRIELTFTSATAFDVTTDADYGALFQDLPAGTVGVPYATTLAANGYTGLTFMPTFTAKNGADAWVSGDIVVIDVEPFPVDFATGEGRLSGQVLIDGDDPNSSRLVIASNTVNTITFANAPSVAPTPDSGIAADLLSTAITFPTTGGTLDVITDITGLVQLTYGVEANTAALAATLNADGIANGLPAGLFTDGLTDFLKINLSTIYDAASSQNGEDQFFEISAFDAELNLTAATSKGVAGDAFRVEAPRELRGGYNGATPTDANYIAAYNVANSVINRLRGRNVGLVKIATPGVTSTLVQQAGKAYAEFRNYQYRCEIPSNYTEETAVVDYINNTLGRSDYAKLAFPSFANVVNKTGRGTVLQSLTGAILGREAKTAKDWKGYHKAAAGTDVTLPNVVSLPTGERELDEEVLNPQGVNVIKKKKGNFIVWGSRTISSDPEWKFAHAREYISHTEQVLIENFDFVIFGLNSESERENLIPIFNDFFSPEWQKGAIVGPKLKDAVQLKIDGENNTAATSAAGDSNVSISLAVVDMVERLNITVGKAGVTSSK